ncbi:hypothetical protein HYC85_025681 [Camellia sinensis]|uniref:CS domain-containing protein n=1 Tax=Camellia sinensis TaxID=4442 RepID=A0A7J7GD06_CAMSI|nr:hypothetical protein HYC85_025681 [Camellia sinensis]
MYDIEGNHLTSTAILGHDGSFLENEKRYEEVKKTILGEGSKDDADVDSDAGSDDEDDEESDEEDEEKMEIKDETKTNPVNLRRKIYLTIMSSVDFEEAGHKLLKIKLEPCQEFLDGPIEVELRLDLGAMISKKQDPDLKWPDIIESWESLTVGVMQLLKGTSIYLVGVHQKSMKKLLEN